MPTMRMRAEKKMRKHLLEQLKSRKIFGARIAKGYKTPEQLMELNLAPQVFLFKNLFSGQVLYSQVPAFHQDQIDAQFPRPNWQNRKPSRRNDLWRIMCVADFASYDYAVAAYDGLVQLRYVRDVLKPKEAMAMRKKNEEGNIWYSGQYRPCFSQEAVADLAHVINEFELEGTALFWENVWRKGEDSHWRSDLVDHEVLPPFNPKYQSIMLDELREKSLAEFGRIREENAAQENGEPESAQVGTQAA
ncbi:Piso0_004287 [Millerozyma farinosa CBS 7064]|uniref:Large ribosomal subunit protein mL67 n=1 Tax=Pichia sorbitophila (strain ATCC MYA-4447 / BCRC 22081 / CBS 7064 / NBRC 10061 / NRRL Y-12695) TaxID=559304 RepID=G8Y802_PICSO|nr:Piso0_004287 [Millerozyma farinosa CBS 7064]CCE84732.1 Piso0_004287 [Millerozyma farinosa CBS 7064]